tara:strand:+ start:389 stop:541 length:153 start_codon:yes stop_codon:yes gene_type:complete
MLSTTKYSSIATPAVIAFGIAWIGNRTIKNEKNLKIRELELKLQLNKKFE